MGRVIFSIDTKDEMASYRDYILVLGFLHNAGIKVKEASGCINGSTSRVFICNLNHLLHHKIIKMFARQFKQEYITIVKDNGVCNLEYLRGTKLEYAGTWQVIDRKEATESSNYTYDVEENLFYKAA